MEPVVQRCRHEMRSTSMIFRFLAVKVLRQDVLSRFSDNGVGVLGNGKVGRLGHVQTTRKSLVAGTISFVVSDRLSCLIASSEPGGLLRGVKLGMSKEPPVHCVKGVTSACLGNVHEEVLERIVVEVCEQECRLEKRLEHGGVSHELGPD